jgi:hypothetical protein
MKDQFIPYEQALSLKELGFDEPCFGYYNGQGNYIGEEGKMNSNCNKLGMHGTYCTAPLYQQAFRWFREKYNLKGFISPVEYLDGTDDTYHWCIYNKCNSGNDQLTYEEAELECLKKLIEIVKQK